MSDMKSAGGSLPARPRKRTAQRCHECNYLRRVLKNGRMSVHKLWIGDKEIYCKGSGDLMKPKELNCDGI